MKILTVENKQLELNDIEDEIPPTNFTVVDLGSDINHNDEADIIFPIMIYLEEVTAPAIECTVAGNKVLLPLTWHIFIGEDDLGEVEAVPITSINARDFDVIVTAPIRGYRHKFETIHPRKVLQNYEWVLPRIKNGQAIAVPINDANECIYITPKATRIPAICHPEDFL